jgi:hypothetical protein
MTNRAIETFLPAKFAQTYALRILGVKPNSAFGIGDGDFYSPPRIFGETEINKFLITGLSEKDFKPEPCSYPEGGCDKFVPYGRCGDYVDSYNNTRYVDLSCKSVGKRLGYNKNPMELGLEFYPDGMEIRNVGKFKECVIRMAFKLPKLDKNLFEMMFEDIFPFGDYAKILAYKKTVEISFHHDGPDLFCLRLDGETPVLRYINYESEMLVVRKEQNLHAAFTRRQAEKIKAEAVLAKAGKISRM